MVYLFLADGFEEIEALTQVDYLRRAGIEINTVGVTGEYVTGARRITVKADIALGKAVIDGNTEMLILPGGLGGVEGLKNSPAVMEMLKSAYDKGIYIAAICAAPTILAPLGFLRGRDCTCYPDMMETLTQFGGELSEKPVVRDGRIITAKAAGASEQFSFELISILKDKEQAEKVRLGICARYMTSQEIRDIKNVLRKELMAKRNEIGETERRAMDLAIADNVTASVSFSYADVVLLYASCKGEADTWEILRRTLEAGKKAAFPKAYRDGKMDFFLIDGKEQLEKGNFGVPEPADGLEKFDQSLFSHPLCLVPALSFDRDGFRIGYGKGYYDRFLAKFSGISAGLEYECLVNESLIRDKRHDKKVDLLVTEKKVYVIGQKEKEI